MKIQEGADRYSCLMWLCAVVQITGCLVDAVDMYVKKYYLSNCPASGQKDTELSIASFLWQRKSSKIKVLVFILSGAAEGGQDWSDYLKRTSI